MKTHLFVFVILSFATHANSNISTDSIQKRYGRVAALSADIVQSKDSKHLAQSIKSKIKLTYEGGEIRWHMTSPVESLTVLNSSGITVSANGSPPKPLTMGPQQNTALFVAFLKAMLSVDLELLKKDFELTSVADGFVVKPKTQSKYRFIDQLVVHFTDNLDLKEMSLIIKGEMTQLVFTNVRVTSLPKSAPNKP